MAFIDDNDKLLQNQDPNQQQAQAQGGQPQATSGQAQVLGGQQSNVVGQGSSTAGVGAGGTGGWTNIQSYIDANKADTGSSGLLQNKVGAQFDKEKSNIDTQSQNLKSEAEKAVGSVTDVKQNADKYLADAGQGYDWGGNQAEAYKSNVSKFQNALENGYQGPSNFAYGFDQDTQKYGTNLKDDGGFDQIMQKLYGEAAGQNISQGGNLLQKQLDVNNESLRDTRKSLIDRYSGLGDYRDQVSNDTNSALNKAATDYGNTQSALRTYLGNKGGALEAEIGKQEDAARTAYEQAYNGGSGHKAYDWDRIQQNNATSPVKITPQGQINAGIWGDNLSYSQLAKEAEFAKQYAATFHNEDNVNALNDFYSQQDSKYANTADAEERQWNALQDIFRSDAERKKQGFKVRG